MNLSALAPLKQTAVQVAVIESNGRLIQNKFSARGRLKRDDCQGWSLLSRTLLKNVIITNLENTIMSKTLKPFLSTTFWFSLGLALALLVTL